MEGPDLSEDGMVEEKYRPPSRDDELITDDFPNQKEIDPFPVQLVRVFTEKETRFGEHTFQDEEEDPLRCDEPELENEETCLSGDGDVTSGNGVENISDEDVSFGLLAKKEEVDITEDISSAVLSEDNPSEANSSNEEIHVIHNCCYCSKEFEDKDSFRKHMSVHRLELPIEDDDSIEGSASINQNPDDEGHSCQFCGKVFKGQSKLKMHMIVHSNERPYRCNSCHKRFKSAGVLKTHHIRIHINDKYFRCNTCYKSFRYKQRLVYHMSHHKAPRHLECTICNKTFKQPYYLKQHMRMHTGEKPFSCSFCGEQFSYKSNLNMHVKSHIGNGHECRFCYKVFSDISILNEHMLVHTNKERFVCEVCDRGFRQPHNLKAHMSVHTKEKPYPCSLCNARFSYPLVLKRHVKIHTKDKPSSV